MVTLVPAEADSTLGSFVNSLVEKRQMLAESGMPVRVAWLNEPFSIAALCAC
jgi:hypothetical protein